VALAGSHGGSKADKTNDDKDDGPGVGEIEEAATQFRQEKENADGNDDDGTHEAADAATLTGATNTIAHR
jgi:hypothetical protein